MTPEWDVVVIGGGLAGLAAGATATKAGLRTLVLEAHTLGGRARVTQRKQFVFNLGFHALYKGGPGCRMLHELGMKPQGSSPPLDRYQALRDDELHLLPLSRTALDRTTLFRQHEKRQFATLLDRASRANPERLAGTSVSDWLADAGCSTRVVSTMSALVRLTTYVSDLNAFSADAAVRQLQVAASGVMYLHGGWTQLIEGLASLCQVRTGIRVNAIAPAAGRIEVATTEGPIAARSVVLAVGTPAATAALLPAPPQWANLGPEVTAACLDAGLRRVPEPGYVLGIDEPVYAAVQSPPARQAPDGCAVVGGIRYGATGAKQDRVGLESHLARAGVQPEDVVSRRFLARMVVAGAAPTAVQGGLVGRPTVDATGVSGVYVAGDWVGPIGLISDAALFSGHLAALKASRHATGT